MKIQLFNKFLILFFIIFSTPCLAGLDSKISVNVRNAPIKGVLESIASKAGLQLVMDPSLTLNVSVTQNDVMAKQVLDILAADHMIEFSISGTKLFVDSVKGGSVSGNAVGDAYQLQLRYAMANELVSKLGSMVPDGKIIADEHSNKIIFVGSKKSFDKLKSLVGLFDTQQKQIMIEAIIVETSHNFLQSIGIGISNAGSSTAVTGSSTNPGPSSPNGTFNAILGKINSQALNVKLTAAESKGAAKIVSRPKVVTLNNRLAKVESGVTINIKTLSNVSSGIGAIGGTGPGQGVVTGGVTSIDATLSLSILPMIIGDDQVKLTVEINDSSPDTSSVDGVPGILKNTASTAVILKNKQTAVIAGLVKQTKSKGSAGIPFLSDIPILGNLFKSNAITDNNNELVIFLTPTIDDSGNISLSADGADPALLVKSPLDPEIKVIQPVEEDAKTAH